MESHRLRRKIIETLLRPEVQKIRFSCGTRTVNNVIFNKVADRLRKKKLHVDVDPDELDDATEAKYSSRHHTFIFDSRSYGASRQEQAVIVHESVHAGFD